MTASVKLNLGNMFDGPTDVVVLPCSTGGTVTGFVARTLSHYSLPHPAAGMRLGEVEILPFEGGENIAQFVAFAASVKSMTSSLDAIESIAVKLGEFTRKESSARVISVPLLGAGAGGLQSEAVIAALKKGFENSAHDGATLIVHVLHKEVFDRLRGNRRRIAGRPKDAVRVFISHTSTTDEGAEWVKELALFLIDNGIQARLDRFHLRRGMDLPQWMCNELALAQKVIVVCDETYKQKADGRLGGVGWETMIIQGDVANLPPDSTKYQVVVRAEDINKGLPLYLRTKYAFHAHPSDTKQSFREELVRELLDLPLDERLEAKQFSL
ncbi:toll/interleukin-1 receptor domain-containing protein [Geobacter grbiciae]|uniref:toll/interleukin-1 receptor domain-containing protein n=1 Tax=Geobacter grbiciae TaxID=155042 RepID=UPI001C016325|nr:toll/interleukin-1 receptor domain-containing protein [Geobacter grbiciae]MBT1077066.1 TIR domain-containing protein [Geobacter grbiciae]